MGFDKYLFLDDWCLQGMAFPCVPDCFWVIDNNGLSVTNAQGAPLHFVAPWNPISSIEPSVW